MPLSSVAVFSGSSAGTDPSFRSEATRLGRVLARRGTELVCGGGRSGLMEAVVAGSLSEGGDVTAVIPPTEREDSLNARFTRVIFVDSLHERKAVMERLAQGFLALPGGSGTLEELMEQWTWVQVGLHDKPLGVLNVSGYFDPLIQMLENMRLFGFTKPNNFRHILISDRLADILHHLDRAQAWRTDV